MRRIGVVLTTLVLVIGLASAAFAGSATKTAPGRGAQGLGVQAVAPVGASSLRVSGANRYATAAAISETTWSYETTFTVYLASGESLPDALALGPSTLNDGPLLLTGRDVLPPETRAELARLRPCLILAVGGPAAVSDAVLAEADGYTEPCGE